VAGPDEAADTAIAAAIELADLRKRADAVQAELLRLRRGPGTSLRRHSCARPSVMTDAFGSANRRNSAFASAGLTR
jgi:hypothetical protein